MGVGVGELSGGWDYDKEGERMDKQQDGGPARQGADMPAQLKPDDDQMVAPDIDPGNAYRRLMPTDILRQGDECWFDGKWWPTGDEGYYATGLPYRRRREEPFEELEAERNER